MYYASGRFQSTQALKKSLNTLTRRAIARLSPSGCTGARRPCASGSQRPGSHGSGGSCASPEPGEPGRWWPRARGGVPGLLGWMCQEEVVLVAL